MTAREPARPVWQRPGRCDSGACVEVGVLGDVVAVRNSTDPEGPVLWFTRAEWKAFVAGVKAGDFGP
jgi:uncharacterized protein DUF397